MHRHTNGGRTSGSSIDEVKTLPHVPVSTHSWSNLIGTIRREFLDQVLFWNGRDLERKLQVPRCYNAARGHASLEGHTPLTFTGGHIVARAAAPGSGQHAHRAQAHVDRTRPRPMPGAARRRAQVLLPKRRVAAVGRVSAP